MTDDDYQQALIRVAQRALEDPYLAEAEPDDDEDEEDWGDFRPYYSGQSHEAGPVVEYCGTPTKCVGLGEASDEYDWTQPKGSHQVATLVLMHATDGRQPSMDEISALAATIQQESAETGVWKIAQEDVLD